MKPTPTIAAYYFPNYHVDPRNEQAHGKEWTEWELVKAATPRWPGHDQPRTPLWGYTDEADPVHMAQKIAAAADHGIDAFVFDWYWYDDGPFLQRGLDEGFLGAANRDRLKFALMWANHDWRDIHPQKRTSPAPLQYSGKVKPWTFDTIVTNVLERYFQRPNYWRLDGAPYFSIFDLACLLESFGGVDATAAALAEFRRRTRAAGHRDLHLNLVLWHPGILQGDESLPIQADLVRRLGFDSVTSYVWILHAAMESFPTMPYPRALEKMLGFTRSMEARFPELPYFPNVTMGWDASPRTVQTERFENIGYPYMSTLADNTPANFKRALTEFKGWLATRPPAEQVLMLNAWNEWTEGSYLEPDIRHGLGYLEAVRDVFGTKARPTK